MDLAARHIGFVLASYAVAFVLLAGLIIAFIARMRAVRRRLAALEAQGARRRKAAAPRQSEKPQGAAQANVADSGQEASSS